MSDMIVRRKSVGVVSEAELGAGLSTACAFSPDFRLDLAYVQNTAGFI
jgi:hypothetical protein